MKFLNPIFIHSSSTFVCPYYVIHFMLFSVSDIIALRYSTNQSGSWQLPYSNPHWYSKLLVCRSMCNGSLKCDWLFPKHDFYNQSCFKYPVAFGRVLHM